MPSSDEVRIIGTIFAVTMNPSDRPIGETPDRKNLSFDYLWHLICPLQIGESVILTDLGLDKSIVDAVD
jgi:hypothetical protein